MPTFIPSVLSAKPNSGWWPLPDSWYPFDQGTSSSDKYSMDQAIKALSEAQIDTVSKMNTLTEIMQWIIKDERAAASSPLNQIQVDDIRNRVKSSYDAGMKAVAADRTAAGREALNLLINFQALAAKYGAPRTHQALTEAIKWTSANTKSFVKPKADDPHLTSKDSKPPSKPPNDGLPSWVVPVAITGAAGLALGVYYFIYVRPKSR